MSKGKRKRSNSAPPRMAGAGASAASRSRANSMQDLRRKKDTSDAPPDESRERLKKEKEEAPRSSVIPATSQFASAPPDFLLLKILGGNTTVFEDDDALTTRSVPLAAFIRFAKNGAEVSRNFAEALVHLYKLSPRKDGMFGRVVAVLEKMKQGETLNEQEADVLQAFIEYQVFRRGEHLKTEDEAGWTENKITPKILEEHPELPGLMFDHPDDIAGLAKALMDEARKKEQALVCTEEEIRGEILAILKLPGIEVSHDLRRKGLAKDLIMNVLHSRLKTMLIPIVGQNYMCRCRYSQPSPTLLRRDLPLFVMERLRVRERRGAAVHIFQTKNGYSIAYDPGLLKLNREKTYTVEQLAERSPEIRNFLKSYSPPGPLEKARTFELVSFDSGQFVLADVQAPVMDDTVEIALPRSGRPPVRLKIGKRPEEVGIRMTDEPAGVFKRSLNSQRVIEIADWDDEGNKVVFQLKGSGVPAYGFMSDPDWSGGEYLALTIEKGAMLLRNFIREVFGLEDVVPTIAGVAMISGSDVATNEEKAGRFGAVSFRLDRAMGVRLSNILYESVKEEISRRFSLAPDDLWRAGIVRKLARNMALVNLFGLQYNDSGVTKLVDVGMHGEFADTGGLWNLNRAPQLIELALVQGIKQHIGSEYAKTFDEHYVSEMLNALERIAERLPEEIARDFRRAIEPFNLYKRHEARLKAIEPKWKSNNLITQLREIQQLLLAYFVEMMGGDDKGPTLSQRAYEAGGIKEFAGIIITNMAEFNAWMRKIILRHIIAGQLEDVIQALGIKNEMELRAIIGLSEDDPWPDTGVSYTFQERLVPINRDKKWDQ